MAQAESRSWWADVEDVRERIERRRARLAAVADPVAADDLPGSDTRQGRFSRHAEPTDDKGGWTDRSARAGEPRGRFTRDADAYAEPAFARPSPAPAPAPAPAGARRTVRIGGHGDRRLDAVPLRVVDTARPSTSIPRRKSGPARAIGIDIELHAEPAPRRERPRSSRPVLGPNPDRLAAWAFALAFLTLLIAAISAHGL